MIGAFGVENRVCGSGWALINTTGGFRYAAALRAVERRLDDDADLARVLRHDPARLFGFEG